MRLPLLTGSLTLAGLLLPASGGTLRFNRDIRPILSENCFHCHGQDAAKRKADLRLDTWEGATAVLENGPALVPGKPEDSALLKRMESRDPDEQMPPPESHRTVTPQQLALVRQWIAEGAAYETHWAFVPPRREALPAAAAWDRVPWDAWVRNRLERDGLAPSPEAAPAAWLRRVSFDLTGFSPAPDEIAAFHKDVAARGESAYRAVVERLLGSPRYGERMTSEWLDVARYADTHGFNNDSARSMWRWRDWVISAFNQNLTYDRFITRQLAGDLLPSPNLDDRIATGFCRNHVINSEGGIIDEEYRVEYVADRVRTLGMAWLGLTMECSRCHDHKYDPVTAKDYYRLYAFFNQVPEWGEDGRVANAAPLLSAPTEAQQRELAALDRRMAGTKAEQAPGPLADRSLTEILTWLKTGVPQPALPGEASLTTAVGGDKVVNAAKPDQPLGHSAEFTNDAVLGPVFRFPAAQPWKLEAGHFDSASNKAWTFSTAVRWLGREGVLLSSMDYRIPLSSVAYGNGTEIRLTEQGQVEVRVAQHWPAYSIHLISGKTILAGQWHRIAVVSHGTDKASGLRVFIDGRESAVTVKHDGLSGSMGGKPLLVGASNAVPADLFQGELAGLMAWPKVLDDAALRNLADAEFVNLTNVLPDGGSEAVRQLDRVQTLVRDYHPSTRMDAEALSAMETTRLSVQRGFPTVMVMSELAEPRPSHVLLRGTYDAPGESVSAGVPETLLGAWPAGAPRNRLGLAQWLTKPDHPLTARVVVNRFWQQIFGTGLVKTSEDFGFQSEYPPHPELLDWLARDFIDGGWNVKDLLRSIVLSATYRQDSKVSPELLLRDPENRLLARGPRFRLPAEMIRDHALAASGLLRERLGGPGVFPDQPEDLYKGVVVDAPYPGTKWVPGTGDDLHRRSLYTFWKRTVPHPVMNVFDTPDREFGCVRRSRTNTPLQALTLMNEPALLRAAGHLGQRLRSEGGSGDASRLAWGFNLATARPPTAREAAVLLHLLSGLRKSYQADPAGAAAMVKSGGIEAPVADQTEAASWTALASNLLNLDETLTKN